MQAPVAVRCFTNCYTLPLPLPLPLAVTVVVGETKEEMNINDYRDDIIHCTATEADKFVKQRRYRYHIAK